MSEENKEIIRKVNDALFTGDYQGFLEHCTDDLQWIILGDRAIQGKEALRQFAEAMADVRPQPLEVKLFEPIIADGDFVVARGNMTMKENDGKTEQYEFCSVYRFRGDKIAEQNSYVIKTEPKAEVMTGA